MKWFVTASNRLDHVDLYRWLGSEAGTAATGQAHPGAQDTEPPLHRPQSTVLYASLQDSDEVLAIDLATQGVRWKRPWASCRPTSS